MQIALRTTGAHSVEDTFKGFAQIGFVIQAKFDQHDEQLRPVFIGK
jgi:hypothetical protein